MPPDPTAKPANLPAILQIIPALDAGGAERTTVDVAEALARAGFLPLVASEGGRLEPALAARGGELIAMPLDTKWPHALAANALRLARIARARNVKLIHARSRAPAWSAAYAARRTGTPFVTTYHGIYNAGNPFKRFYNSVMVRADAVIANSEWTADHIVTVHGVPRDRITVIHRGIDLALFDPASVAPDRVAKLRGEWGAKESDIVVLLPGRLTRWKGQLVLIEALARMKRASGIRAVLAGDAQGRTAYEAELETSIARAGLGARVAVVGHVADMTAAYLAADIVVSASTDPEAFGRVAAEAGAMKRPVVATDHGGARETVVAGQSGLLVPPGDAEALARALETLADMDANARAAMGAKGRAHVAGNFTLERMCADTIALYRRLLRS